MLAEEATSSGFEGAVGVRSLQEEKGVVLWVLEVLEGREGMEVQKDWEVQGNWAVQESGEV